MKKIFGCLFFFCHFLPAITQPLPRVPTLTMKPARDGSVQFFSDPGNLCPVPGRKAFYTYFYEFGDGTFSTNKNPIHRYPGPGSYKVILCVTNNYDKCETPQIVQQSFVVTGTGQFNATPTETFFDGNKSVGLRLCRDPRPGDPLIAYLGYRPQQFANSSGYLVLFFNDKHFFRKSFNLLAQRSFHGEHIQNSDPGVTGKSYSMFRALDRQYINRSIFSYTDLKQGTENFLYFTLQMPADLKPEIDHWITMTAMMIPDNPNLDPEKFEISVKVVASYDPNQLYVNQYLIDRHSRREKKLDYKVKFQNIGDGPARHISIAADLSGQLKNASLKVTGMSPVIPFCKTGFAGGSCLDTLRRGDSIYFMMRNIYLSGREEKASSRHDTTSGFISYTLSFARRLKRKAISSRAKISFDNNEPIFTNTATARFVKTQGIVAGYEFPFADGNYKGTGPIRIGYTVTRNTASKFYFQLEAYAALLHREDSSGQVRLKSVDSTLLPFGAIADTIRKDFILSRQRNLFQLVPLQLRYHVNNWVSIGVGIMGQIAVSEKNTLKDKYFIQGRYRGFPPGSGQKFDTLITRTASFGRQQNSKWWSLADMASFADLQLGQIRTGVIIGLRYYRQWDGHLPNRFYAYAGFKF